MKSIAQGIKGFFKEFETFASRGNFLDLAVGIVIGTSFSAVTTALVNDIITPPIGLLLGRVNFANLVIHLGGTVAISYGLFLQTLINFIITAFALFLIVRLINRLETLAQKKKQDDASDAAPAPADSPEVIILKEILDTLKANPESTIR